MTSLSGRVIKGKRQHTKSQYVPRTLSASLVLAQEIARWGQRHQYLGTNRYSITVSLFYIMLSLTYLKDPIVKYILKNSLARDHSIITFA